MIADAIRDVSARGEIVLDLFGESGSTLIAAEKTGRRARLCEIDPLYCDIILARYEAWAKDEAVLVERLGEAGTAVQASEAAPVNDDPPGAGTPSLDEAAVRRMLG